MFVYFISTVSVFSKNSEFVSSNLPIIIIDTHGQTIQDEVRILADMGIIDNGEGQRNQVDDPFNDYNGIIAIELRGTTSKWFPKQPYRFETQNIQGDNLNISLLGMPKENDWVLYNPYSDKSLIRNVMAYKISNDLGRYASRTRFCELILNGDYKGVYVLMEKIKRDKNRVDISEMDHDDVAGDALTGGYIIKIDKLSGKLVDGWDSESNHVYYQYHYPKADEINEQQKVYIQNFMNEFESVMQTIDYDDPVHGYAKYINLDSFVDYFIVNEVCRNIDGYRLSTFMYKDRDSKGGKLIFGPVWDFNLSFGNADYYDGFNPNGWNLDLLMWQSAHDFHPPYWMKTLREDETFKGKLYQRWQALRREELDLDSLLAEIDFLAGFLDEAQQRNFERWPILGEHVWPNAFIGDTYQEEIDFMKTWLEERIVWMDEAIESYRTLWKGDDIIIMGQNYPNPFKEKTTISFTLKKEAYVDLNVFDIRGRRVSNIIHGNCPADTYVVEFDARDLSSGMYLCCLSAEKKKISRKMIVVR